MIDQRAYLRDCLDAMAEFPDKFFDLAVVDPPYGIGIAKEKPRKSGRWNYIPKNWDNATPSPNYFAELQRVSTNQIIWGGNYFTLPPSRCWIIWDKQQPVENFADAEMAWTNFNKVVQIFRFSFAANKEKIHPTQKPIALYDWIFANYAKAGQKVLDTHLGSGSSRIAANKAGIDFWGYELDPDYFAAHQKRYANFVAQLRMF